MEFEQKPEVLHCYELLSMQYLEQSQDEDIWKMLNLWSQDQVEFAEIYSFYIFFFWNFFLTMYHKFNSSALVR